VRHNHQIDPSGYLSPQGAGSPDLFASPAFRRGFALLKQHGLSFDACLWLVEQRATAPLPCGPLGSLFGLHAIIYRHIYTVKVYRPVGD
jgi:hypothetical protein